MTRRLLPGTLFLGWALCLLLPFSAQAEVPTAREVRRALESRQRDRIEETFAALRGELDARLVAALLDSGAEVHATGLYDELVDLLRTSHGDALQALARSYSRERNPAVRFLILDALTGIADPLADETLAEAACGDREPSVSIYAVRQLAARGSAGAVDALLDVLEATEEDRARGVVAREANTALVGLSAQDYRGSAEWRQWWEGTRDSWGREGGAQSDDASGGGTRTRTVLDRMRESRPGDLHTLERLEDDAIVVIEGDYDQVQDVLEAMGLPCLVYSRAEFPTLELDPDKQVLILNCDGALLDEDGVRKVREFVSRGGYLFSSDWELSNCLTRSFPEAVGSGGRRSDTHTVDIQPTAAAAGHPLLRDLFPINPWELEAAEFTWQVDGASEFVQPRGELTVLVEAPDLQALYGTTAVAVTFGFQNGRPVTGTLPPPPARPVTGGGRGAGSRRRGRDRERGEQLPGRVLHVLSHFQHQQDAGGDGYALQQLLLNFIVEKQEQRRWGR
jgi:hypothetical protein